MSNWSQGLAQRVSGELLRFAVIGVLATLTHVACYLALYPGMLSSAAAANVVAFSLAVFVSYLGNARWVFPHSEGGRAEVVKFCVSALTGLGLNTFFAWYLVDVRGASRYLSVALMVSVTPLAVFALNKYFVFTSRTR